MADPAGDVERLRIVLELCRSRGIPLVRLRVGDIELVTSPPVPASDGPRPPTREELLEIGRREFNETMYAGSVGDLPEFGES